MIIEFLSESYKKTLEFIAWVVIVLTAILFAIIAYNFCVAFELINVSLMHEKVVLVIAGLVFGGFGGLLLDSIIIPPLLLLVEIRDSLKK